MVIACPKCKKKLKIPDEKIKSSGIKFRCLKCSTVIVYKPKAVSSNKTAEPELTSDTTIKTSVHNQDKDGQDEGFYSKNEDKAVSPPEETEGKKIAESEPEHEGPSPEDVARAQETKKRYGFMVAEKERLDEKPFFEYLPNVVSYPLSGGGLLMLGIGTVCFTVLLLFAKFAMIFGMIGFVFVGGYLFSFMMKIISHTADGEIELPEWPDFTDWWDDIIIPMFQIIMVTIVSYLPLIIFVILGASSSIIFYLVAFLLLILGILYQPMALISISIHDIIKALNPLVLVPAILKVPLDYSIACGVLLLLFIVKTIFHAFIMIPILGPFLDNFIMLYLLVVEARILGLIYYANKDKFGWI